MLTSSRESSDGAGEVVVLLLSQLVTQPVARKLDVVVGNEPILCNRAPKHASLRNAHREGVLTPAHVVVLDEGVAGEATQPVERLSGPELSLREGQRVAQRTGPRCHRRVTEQHGPGHGERD